jgi:hypothetical protein
MTDRRFPLPWTIEQLNPGLLRGRAWAAISGQVADEGWGKADREKWSAHY